MKAYLKLHGAQLLIAALITVTFLAGVMPPDAAAGLALVPMIVGNTYAPFPVRADITAVAIAYRNPKLIADSVLPRVPVDSQKFEYRLIPKGTFFTVPETEVGRKGQPNQVEFTGEEVVDATKDHALDDPVPNADIENARTQPNLPDPLLQAGEGISALIELAREKRTAALVFDPAQYAATNKVALVGNDRWDVNHADSNPIIDVTTGLDACIMRPNIMTIGRAAFTKLSMHPKIVQAYNQNAGDGGIVPRSYIATLFELDEVLVGEGWINIAKKGQAPNMVRVWGKHCALLYRDKLANTKRGTTFGFTAQWGTRIGGAEYDKNIGMRGGQMVRVGESVKELITANDLGYFIENCVG